MTLHLQTQSPQIRFGQARTEERLKLIRETPYNKAVKRVVELALSDNQDDRDTAEDTLFFGPSLQASSFAELAKTANSKAWAFAKKMFCKLNDNQGERKGILNALIADKMDLMAGTLLGELFAPKPFDGHFNEVTARELVHNLSGSSDSEIMAQVIAQGLSKATEDRLIQFVTKPLPFEREKTERFMWGNEARGASLALAQWDQDKRFRVYDKMIGNQQTESISRVLAHADSELYLEFFKSFKADGDVKKKIALKMMDSMLAEKQVDYLRTLIEAGQNELAAEAFVKYKPGGTPVVSKEAIAAKLFGAFKAAE